MDKKRFSKSRALEVLSNRAARIAKEQSFDRGNGTSQLHRHGGIDQIIDRAVQYGRMRAFEEFASDIEGNFRFED